MFPFKGNPSSSIIKLDGNYYPASKEKNQMFYQKVSQDHIKYNLMYKKFTFNTSREISAL